MCHDFIRLIIYMLPDTILLLQELFIMVGGANSILWSHCGQLMMLFSLKSMPPQSSILEQASQTKAMII